MRDKQIKDLRKFELIRAIRGKEKLERKIICENLCNLREKGRLPDERQIDKRLEKIRVIRVIRGEERPKRKIICENLCNLREKRRLPDERQIDKRLEKIRVNSCNSWQRKTGKKNNLRKSVQSAGKKRNAYPAELGQASM